jgi:hypothetical protein
MSPLSVNASQIYNSLTKIIREKDSADMAAVNKAATDKLAAAIAAATCGAKGRASDWHLLRRVPPPPHSPSLNNPALAH